MNKSNLQIELECSLNWLEVYRENGIAGWRWLAMRIHVNALQRRLAGKVDA